MPEIALEPLHHGDRERAVEILARAYVTNPIHVAAFGGDDASALELNRVFFREAMRSLFGEEFTAVRADGELVGVMRMVRSPQCTPPREVARRVFPPLLEELGEAGPRVATWLGTWGRLDPEAPHWHLGPIAVLPEVQGQRIGMRLMQEYCLRVDAERESGYLETDSPQNVAFYEKSGFNVTHEEEVLGIPTWYMFRGVAAV